MNLQRYTELNIAFISFILYTCRLSLQEMLKIFGNKIFLAFTVAFSYLILNVFQSKNSTVYRRSLFLFNNTFPHATINKIPKENDPNEKYLTFFTHSGFQNQLIQGIYLSNYDRQMCLFIIII
jgi:hypothetical protein